MDNKKKILLLAVLGGAGFFAYKKFFKKEEKETPSSPSDVGTNTNGGGAAPTPSPNTPTPALPMVEPTKGSLPEPPPVSPNQYVEPVSPVYTPPVSPYVPTYVAPLEVSAKPVTPTATYTANTSTTLPTWTTLSPTSNFAYLTNPTSVTTASGGNAANYYSVTGIRSKRKRKPKFCI